MIDEKKSHALHAKIVEKLRGIAPTHEDMAKLEDAIPEIIESLSSAEKIEETYFNDQQSKE